MKRLWKKEMEIGLERRGKRNLNDFSKG